MFKYSQWAKTLIVTIAVFLMPSAEVVAQLEKGGFSIDKLAFMEGHWVSNKSGYMEEVWLAPKGGTIVGSFRWIFPNDRQVLEFLVIEQVEGEVIFRFKHFDKDFRVWEGGMANTYKLTHVEENRAEFSITHKREGVPQKFAYMRVGDQLTFKELSDSDPDPLALTFHLKNSFAGN